MSSVYDRNDPSKTPEDAGDVKISAGLDQVRHILLLHKLANAYLSLSARTLFAKFLDKREDEPEKDRRAA
jgi:hypothetical protein